MFISILDALLKEKGITASKMLTDLGMNKSSVLNWKTRGTVPSGATLQKIAEYFGVSVDYLLGKSVQKEDIQHETLENKFSANILSDHEKKVILAYRGNPAMQLAVDRLLGISDI